MGTQGRLKKCRSIVRNVTFGRNVLWSWYLLSERQVLALTNRSSARANSYFQGNIIDKSQGVSFSWKGNPDVWKNHYILLIYSFCLPVASFKYDSSAADMKDVKKGTSLDRAAHFNFV